MPRYRWKNKVLRLNEACELTNFLLKRKGLDVGKRRERKFYERNRNVVENTVSVLITLEMFYKTQAVSLFSGNIYEKKGV